jgi:RND family efflux transporter MFP subunit
MNKQVTVGLTSLGVLLGAALVMAQDEGRGSGAVPTGENTVVVSGGLVWLEKSDVSALREGVLKSIEYHVGARVKPGDEIGRLHDEMADLALKKAELTASSLGQLAKAKAVRAQADAELARAIRLLELGKQKGANYIATEDVEKAKANVAVAIAEIQTAEENLKIAAQERDIQKRLLEEHAIIAPFGGIITERYKNPEESVRASEPVVQLVRTDKLRFTGWVPFDVSFRIKEGDLVEVIPSIEGADLPIERTRFRGKVTYLSREVNSLRKTEVQIFADIDNPPNPQDPKQELSPGMKVDMIVYLNGAQPPAGNAAQASAGVRSAR